MARFNKRFNKLSYEYKVIKEINWLLLIFKLKDSIVTRTVFDSPLMEPSLNSVSQEVIITSQRGILKRIGHFLAYS